MILNKGETSVLPSSGAGTNKFSPNQPGFIEKLILVVPTGLTTDVVIDIAQDISLIAAETVYSKTGVSAGTYHIYPRQRVMVANAVSDTLPPARPIFYHDDDIRLTLANATDDSKRVTLYVRWEPADPA